jgi:hypothetical protein
MYGGDDGARTKLSYVPKRYICFNNMNKCIRDNGPWETLGRPDSTIAAAAGNESHIH